MEIRLSILEIAYQNLVYGYQEPDKLIAAPDIKKELTKMVFELYNRIGWPDWVTKKDAVTTFNNARVIESSLVPFGAFAFVNTNYPNDEHYNGLFYIMDPELKKHPVPENILDIVAIPKTRFPEGAEL